MKSEPKAVDSREILDGIERLVYPKYRAGIEKVLEQIDRLDGEICEAWNRGDAEGAKAALVKRQAVDKNHAALLTERFLEAERYAREWKMQHRAL